MLVLVEKTSNGYRASSGKPLEVKTEGSTRDEALGRLRELVAQRLQGEVELVEMNIPGEPRTARNPWLQLYGAFKNDPTYDDWQAKIAESRRVENEAAGIFPERNS